MNSIVLMASRKSYLPASVVFPALLTKANLGEDGAPIFGVLTEDAEHGEATLRGTSDLRQIGSFIAFGRAIESLRVDPIPDMEPRLVLPHFQVGPIKVLHLPSPLSPWWTEDENMVGAIEACRYLHRCWWDDLPVWLGPKSN